MSENIEFISAADLPTTEATEVDVLCIENGELKKKSGANLGGNKCDLVFKAFFTSNEAPPTFEIITGSFDEVKKKLDEFNKPSVLGMFQIERGWMFADAIVVEYDPTENTVWYIFVMESGPVYIAHTSDNTLLFD